MDTWIIAAYLLITLALGLFAGAGIGYYAARREMSMPRYRRTTEPPLTDHEIASVADNRFPETLLAPENNQRAEDFIAGASYARSRVGSPE